MHVKDKVACVINFLYVNTVLLHFIVYESRMYVIKGDYRFNIIMTCFFIFLKTPRLQRQYIIKQVYCNIYYITFTHSIHKHTIGNVFNILKVYSVRVSH